MTRFLECQTQNVYAPRERVYVLTERGKNRAQDSSHGLLVELEEL